MPSRPWYLGPALLALAAAGCFDAKPTEVTGGGGVETTEGNLALVGISLSGPAGARVSLIPADFDPLEDKLPDSLTAIADGNGKYSFRGLASGRYNLEAYHPAAGTRCFRPGVVIAKGDRAIPGMDTLAEPGRLRLTWDGVRRGVLTQKGRLFRMDLDGVQPDSGGITLDSLPPGLLPPFSFVAAAEGVPRIWTDSVRIPAGAAISVPVREDWAHMGLLTFDTASLPPDSLGGYPLLVRLASPGFPFDEVSPAGTDIRFTTVDGETLRHAVDAWDAAAGRAEIWVRLPESPRPGFGSLHMHWGNPVAAYEAGPVFDSLPGYLGRWHFNDRTAGGQGLLADAGPFARRTSAVDLVPASLGVIGGAQRFDGKTAYASAEAVWPVGTTAGFSVSAWMAPDTSGMVGGFQQGLPPVVWTLFSNWRQSDTTGFRLTYTADYQQLLLELGFDTSLTRAVTVPLTLVDDEWHLVAATYDGKQAIVWLDGEALDIEAVGEGDLPLPYSDFLIGANHPAGSDTGTERLFTGGIDEVRLSRAVPKAAWHRLDFLAQRPGSAFVGFQKLR